MRCGPRCADTDERSLSHHKPRARRSRVIGPDGDPVDYVIDSRAIVIVQLFLIAAKYAVAPADTCR